MTFSTAPQPALIQPESTAASVSYTAGSFRVSISRSARILRVSMWGFWSDETTTIFVDALRGQLAALGTARGQHLVLCDMTGLPIQSQAIFERFRAMLNGDNSPLRLAIVAGEGGGRMQARRLIAGRPNIALYDNENMAIRWLTMGQ